MVPFHGIGLMLCPLAIYQTKFEALSKGRRGRRRWGEETEQNPMTNKWIEMNWIEDENENENGNEIHANNYY